MQISCGTHSSQVLERFIDENSLQKSWDTFAIKFTRIVDIDGYSHTSTFDHFFWSEDISNNIMVADVLRIASNTSDHCPIYCKINITYKLNAEFIIYQNRKHVGKKLLMNRKPILRLIWRMISLIWKFQQALNTVMTYIVMMIITRMTVIIS